MDLLFALQLVNSLFLAYLSIEATLGSTRGACAYPHHPLVFARRLAGQLRHVERMTSGPIFLLVVQESNGAITGSPTGCAACNCSPTRAS
eukprot:9470821-Pyramimonas_sp.AAC.4